MREATGAAPASFAQIIEKYQDAFARLGNCEEAVFWTKGRQKLRFHVLTSHIAADNFSILDYGCGLAHLKDFLDRRFKHYRYTGADFVPDFVTDDRRRFPNSEFYLVSSPANVPDIFDHAVMSGIFNFRYVESEEGNFTLVKRVLKEVFAKVTVSLAVDFRRDFVNYREPTSYHQSLPDLYDFACRELSPRLELNLTYLPYEYAMIIYKDTTIVEPANFYRDYKHLID